MSHRTESFEAPATRVEPLSPAVVFLIAFAVLLVGRAVLVALSGP